LASLRPHSTATRIKTLKPLLRWAFKPNKYGWTVARFVPFGRLRSLETLTFS
jgi:hypothetical protein